MSQAAQSQNSGIQNSAQPTRNKNIEIENVSSPGQTISLIRNRRINQDTLENQNKTLDIIQKQILLIILKIQLCIVGQVTMELVPLMHPVQFVKPVFKFKMNLKMEPVKQTPFHVIV